MKLNWDQPEFAASEVAQIIDEPVKLVANWTDRGLVDPYQSWERKRGRGRARQYSLRDILTFAAMKDLSDRYEVPVPRGRRICASALVDADPLRTGYVVVEKVRVARRVKTVFCAAAEDLVRHLEAPAMKSALILNMAALAATVESRAKQAITERNSARGANSPSARDRGSSEAITD